jgi:hypothetical protein
MISAASAVATGLISAPSLGSPGERKGTLVGLGQWAIAVGNSAIVSAVTRVIEQEGLRHS